MAGQERNELLEKKESTNIVDNPLVFHVSSSSFSRTLLKKSSQSSSCESENGDTSVPDKDPFLEKAIGGRNVEENKLINAPEDRFHFCYIVLYILGFGSLLPWNFFITANSYFKKKLEARADLQISFQNYFSVAAMVPNVLMMLLNIFVLQRFNRVKRMVIAIVATFLIFVVTTVLVLLDSTPWTLEFFTVTITSVVFLNMFSAVLQGGLYGFAGMLPPKYTTAVMGGQGLSGLFAAVASILSQLGQSSVYKSAFGYFFTACVVLLVCLISIVVLFRLEFVKHFTTERRYKCTCKCDSLGHDHMPDFINEDAGEKMALNFKTKSERKNESYLLVFKKIFPMAFSVTVVFLVTLSCFPSIVSRIVSVSEKKTTWTEFFVPVACFLIFNLGDYFGRTIGGFVQFPKKHWPRWILPVISLSRCLFIPLFIFCNAQPRSFPVVFNHDAFPIVFMLLFASSNGYFGTLSMMYGPSAVDGKNAELAGTIMACCLSIGLGLGAASSFLVTSFI